MYYGIECRIYINLKYKTSIRSYLWRVNMGEAPRPLGFFLAHFPMTFKKSDGKVVSFFFFLRVFFNEVKPISTDDPIQNLIIT